MFYRKSGKLLTVFVALCLLATALPLQLSYAFGPPVPCPCGIPNACFIADCLAAPVIITKGHTDNVPDIKDFITEKFTDFKEWALAEDPQGSDEFFRPLILPAFQLFTDQMTAIAMQQVLIIGTFFDATQQLETQRLFQELNIKAHNDYRPSEDFCWFGTNVRSMANSESSAYFNRLAMNEIQMARHLGNASASGSESQPQDRADRWNQFVNTYCDPNDMNRKPGVMNTGLEIVCGSGGSGNKRKINIDVDYTRLIEEPRTINVLFNNPVLPEPLDSQEDEVLALASNLYGHNVLTRKLNGSHLRNEEYQHLYLALRSVAAKRSVAEDSFNAIVSMKSLGSSDLPGTAIPPETREFLGAVLRELGIPEIEVFEIIGENPSYYAQLEIMAKKIYQNPDFYANLYDTPANVERKSVALRAIETMLDRAIYESQLRQEMAMSVLLSAELNNRFKEANRDLGGG